MAHPITQTRVRGWLLRTGFDAEGLEIAFFGLGGLIVFGGRGCAGYGLDGYEFGFLDVVREVGRGEVVGHLVVEDRWSAEFGAGEVVGAAGDGEEG